MRSDEKINNAISDLTNYLVVNFSDTIKNIGDFYRKYIFDPSEMDENNSDNDDYQTDDF